MCLTWLYCFFPSFLSPSPLWLVLSVGFLRLSYFFMLSFDRTYNSEFFAKTLRTLVTSWNTNQEYAFREKKPVLLSGLAIRKDNIAVSSLSKN